MDYKYIRLEQKDNIGIIFIDRPETLNALNRDLVWELDDAVEQIERNPDIRALIISGGDKNFAAGADIIAMVELNPEDAREFSFKDTFNRIASLSVPTIAAMAGYALGGGLELALSCDIRIAASDVKLGLPEIKLGIFPGAGGTQRLPRLIGAARAKELIFLGSTIDAEKALEYGIINKIVTGSVLEEALKLAQKLSSRPPIALRMAKQLIDQGLNTDINTGVEMEALAWINLFATEDQREGMKAFMEKRKAQFKGR